LASDITSIAWRRQAMYACAYDIGLVRISLVDGSVEIAQISCEAVTDYRGSILLQEEWNALYEYRTYESLLAGEFAATHDGGGGISSMASNGDILYSAWHSAGTVERVDLGTGRILTPLTLQGYDGWLLGMDVTDDGQLAVSGDTWGDTIRIYDAETGSKVRELRLADGSFRPLAPLHANEGP
jgi:WD40 repeat protein